MAKGSGTGIRVRNPNHDSVASSIDDVIGYGTITGKPMAEFPSMTACQDKDYGQYPAAVSHPLEGE